MLRAIRPGIAIVSTGDDGGHRLERDKTESAQRLVPLVYPVTKLSLTYRQFNRRLEKLSLPVRARTGRKCFARWMNEAGIPRTRRRAYLGMQHAKT